jgi:hypothetical protein
VQGGESVVAPKPAQAQLVFSMDVLQASGIPREFVMCATSEASKTYWVSALQEGIEVYRSSSTTRGKEIGAPVLLEKSVHIDSTANLEQIMVTLAQATGASLNNVASPPMRGRAATDKQMSPRLSPRLTSPAAARKTPPPIEVSPSGQRRNTATAVVSPRQQLMSSGDLTAAMLRPPPPSARPPVPQIVPSKVTSSSPQAVVRPLDQSRRQPPPSAVLPPLPPQAQSAPVAQPRPPPRKPTVQTVAAAASLASLAASRAPPPLPDEWPSEVETDEFAVPEAYAPTPPSKSRTRVEVVAATSVFDDTSSGYDTEEILEPFRQQQQQQQVEERLAAFDFEPQDEDQMGLAAGDKIAVELVEGEWLKGANMRTGVAGWCPLAYCTAPL